MLTFLTAICALLLAASCAFGFSLEKEIKLGSDVAAQVEKEMPLSKNEQWQREIAEMGQRFLPHIKRKDIKYHFRIVEAKNELNAFALPGGYIYFTERMWRIMTPDERAAILAHEIIHCDERHGIDNMIKAQQRAIWMLPLLVITGGGAALHALQIGDAIISQRYSRKMEREADEMGIELCKKAGYNPAGAVTSMLKLLHITNDENHYEISSIFASHPDTAKRIDYLSQMAISMGSDPSDLALRAIDDPNRLGNVTRKSRDIRIIYCETLKPLDYGSKVHIKKMMWDEAAQAVTPQTIAVATVLIPGRFPALIIENDEDRRFDDVITGDGVYAAPPPESPVTSSSEVTETKAIQSQDQKPHE